MTFNPFEISIPHVAYACLGGFVVLFGMFSLLLRERLYVGEACWAFIFGVVIGPYAADIFNPRDWGSSSDAVTNTITLEFTRVVLAIGVFAIGVELPKAYMARHWKSLFFLLVPVMTWGWFVSAGLIYALIPGLNFLSSLAVAACLTPTDPILAAAVVGGKYADKHVPAHIRHLLAAESGCNDGAAFPFLYLALYLMIDKTVGGAVRDWFLILWLYEIILGVVIGSVIGFAFRHLMKFCERHNLIDRHSYVAQYISLAMLTIGITTMLGSDDLLSAFACGTAFAWDGFFNRQTEESLFSSVIDLLFNVAAFVFVGAWMPFSDFQNAELTLTVWRLIVIAILVLLLRRLPIMIALYKWIPDVKTFREAIFTGHFGPIGIGAVFISTLAAGVLAEVDEPSAQIELLTKSIQPIVAFMVLCSITVHGLSIPSFSLGRRVHSVSRTWSRHATPDWTNQARLVNRGEDIVINRDSEMERGESDMTPEQKSVMEARRRTVSETGTSSTPEKVVEDGGSLETKKDQHETDTTFTQQKNVPDGDELITEWQEGDRTIIERRAGPGEEVEVQVIQNPPDEVPHTLHSFTADLSTAHPHLSAVLERIRSAPPESGTEHAVRLRERLERELKEAEKKAKEMEQRAKDAFLPPPREEDEEQTQDDDEGWASDRSNGHAPASSSSSPAKKARSKSPKQKNILPKLGASPSRRPRRRTSVRRSNSSAVQPPRPPKVHYEEGGSAHDRGRYSGTKDTQTSHSHQRHDKPHDNDNDNDHHNSKTGDNSHKSRSHNSRPSNFRLDTLRSIHSWAGTPREVSPARSVRFANEDNSSRGPGSGTNTPRGSMLIGDSSPATPATPMEEDTDSPKTKVTFELPRPGKH